MAVAVATASPAIAAEPIALVDDAPDRHVVVKGDTLWGISGKFLQEPWRWPEIWRLNKEQIKNPHLIYPGDIVFLDYVEGQPRLRLGKPVGASGASGNVKLSPQVHSEPIEKAISSIPANAIEAFISRPLVVEANELRDAPRVIGTDESRVIMGNGDEIFVLGITEDHPKWYIYRLGAPLRNPPTSGAVGDKPGSVLGYEVNYLGTAQIKKPGDVSVLEVLSAKEEILKGDLLMPADEATVNAYVPHEVDHEVSGQVVSIYGGVDIGGKFSVVALNLGEQAGIEAGHVLGIYTKHDTVYQDKRGRNRSIALPEKRNGLVFVFRVFKRVSYGLLMESQRPTVIGDSVRNP
jgi:hypothetical protein